MAILLLAAVGCTRQTESSTPGSKSSSSSAAKQELPSQRNDDSCWIFVQGFYDWYVPHTKEEGRASDLALRDKKEAFSNGLFRALERDSRAQAKSTELVGLDFDPFLNSQDPDDRYEVRKVLHKDASCTAEVYGISGQGTRNTPDVLPELIQTNGRWVFANFHYPGSRETDLLTVLKDLARDRRKYAK